MTSLARIVCVVGGVALLASHAASQDVAAQQPPTAPEGIPRRGPPGPPGARMNTIGSNWSQETFTRAVELGERGTFELSNWAGNVRITGDDGSTVRINAVKKVQEPNREAARALLQNILIRVIERGGGVEVITEQPGGRTPFVLVDYDIVVPTATSVTLSNSGGIRVSNVKGELRAEAYSGNISLTSVGRVRQAKAYVGSLFVNGADGDDITADTLGGTLQLRNVRYRNIEVRTVSGLLLVADADCERCSLKTVSGDLELNGALRRNARYSLVSNSGNIRLVTDGAVGFDVEAITSGMVRSDFPTKSGAAPSAQTRGNIWRASYGDGSAILSLRSFTGSISLLRPASGAR